MEDAALANQKRMTTNPFEVILMNMGYAINPDSSGSSTTDDHDHEEVPIQCNPT